MSNIVEYQKMILDAKNECGIIFFEKTNEEKTYVIDSIAKNFIISKEYRYWWHGLKNIVSRLTLENQKDNEFIVKFIKQNLVSIQFSEFVFLILDFSIEQLFILQIKLQDVPKLIDNIWGCEFYISSIKFEWLAGQTKHDEVFISRLTV